MKTIPLRGLLAIASFVIVSCSDDSSTGSGHDGTPDLTITPSMRADCPDTTGLGAPKLAASIPAVAASYQMICQTSIYDSEGYLVYAKDETATIDDTNPYSAGCVGASGWVTTTTSDAIDNSGFYFVESTIGIMGSENTQTRCIYLDDQSG